MDQMGGLKAWGAATAQWFHDSDHNQRSYRGDGWQLGSRGWSLRVHCTLRFNSLFFVLVQHNLHTEKVLWVPGPEVTGWLKDYYCFRCILCTFSQLVPTTRWRWPQSRWLPKELLITWTSLEEITRVLPASIHHSRTGGAGVGKLFYSARQLSYD